MSEPVGRESPRRFETPAVVLAIATGCIYLVCVTYSNSFMSKLGADVGWFRLDLLSLFAFSIDAIRHAIMGSVVGLLLSRHPNMPVRYWVPLQVLWFVLVVSLFTVPDRGVSSAFVYWTGVVVYFGWALMPIIWLLMANLVERDHKRARQYQEALEAGGAISAKQQKRLERTVQSHNWWKGIFDHPIAKYWTLGFLFWFILLFTGRLGVRDADRLIVNAVQELKTLEPGHSRVLFTDGSVSVFACRSELSVSLRLRVPNEESLVQLSMVWEDGLKDVLLPEHQESLGVPGGEGESLLMELDDATGAEPPSGDE